MREFFCHEMLSPSGKGALEKRGKLFPHRGQHGNGGCHSRQICQNGMSRWLFLLLAGYKVIGDEGQLLDDVLPHARRNVPAFQDGLGEFPERMGQREVSVVLNVADRDIDDLKVPDVDRTQDPLIHAEVAELHRHPP